MRVALLAAFDETGNTALDTLRQALQRSGAVDSSQCTHNGMNLGSWLLPNADTAMQILPPLRETLQIDVQVKPIIDVSDDQHQCALAPTLNHVLVSWHFYMHKELELPYLAINDSDVPKRWRPRIPLGTLIDAEPLKRIVWPQALRCTQLQLQNLDQQRIIASQDLRDGPLPW